MRVVVFLLVSIYRAIVRVEHKLDILLVHQMRDKENPLVYLPSVQTQTVDPVEGKAVFYQEVQLPDFGETVFVRRNNVDPMTTSLPESIGGEGDF